MLDICVFDKQLSVEVFNVVASFILFADAINLFSAKHLAWFDFRASNPFKHMSFHDWEQAGAAKVMMCCVCVLCVCAT